MEHLNTCNLCGGKDIICEDAVHHICRCKSCGYIFDNPRPELDEITKFYSQEEKYDPWLKNEKGRDLLWRRRLRKAKKCRSGGSLLDVGAGIGQFLYFARQDFEVCGTEISDSAIKIAREKYNIELIKDAVEKIDFGNRRFDVITIFQVLEHVSDPSRVIEKCIQLLSDGGILVVAVPNEIHSLVSFLKRSIKKILSFLPIARFKNYGKYGLPKVELNSTLKEVHLSHFTVKSLERLLLKYNLKIIDNSLDPYYVSLGIKKWRDDVFYFLAFLVLRIFGLNIYPSIWMVARKD